METFVPGFDHASDAVRALLSVPENRKARASEDPVYCRRQKIKYGVPTINPHGPQLAAHTIAPEHKSSSRASPGSLIPDPVKYPGICHYREAVVGLGFQGIKASCKEAVPFIASVRRNSKSHEFKI